MHQLALPLPVGYSNTKGGEFSFFSTESTKCVLPFEVEQYLDSLCAFMKETKIIQRHPDDFFDFVDNAFLDSSRHLDGTEITLDEREKASNLCSSLGNLLHLDTLQHDMRELIKNGPPTSASNIYDFHMKTKDLLLNRSRRINNDSVSLTLGTPSDAEISKGTTMEDEEERMRKRRILELVMSRRMNQKKKHEVEIMCYAIADLVSCCRGSKGEKDVETVINIGEGKGYVSRSLSMVHHLQVVGLDCNPAHKAEALEHTENLLLSSFNKGNLDSNTGERPLNLLYEPRGHLTSIVCRVQEKIDWKALLTGYVHLCDSEGKTIGSLTDALQEEENESEWAGVDKIVTSDMRDSKVRCQKLKCKVSGCKRILRRSFAAVSRHVHQHLNDKNCVLDFTTREEIHRWNATVPPEEFSQKLVETFFERVDWGSADINQFEETSTRRKGNMSGSGSNFMEEHNTLQFVYCPRGYRAKVLFDAAIFNNLSVGEERLDLGKGIREGTLTVLGFNEASNAHQIVFDGAKEKFHVTLVQLPGTSSANASTMHTGTLTLLSSTKNAVVVSILPPTRASKPMVEVPHLHNTVMVGLHPCGDLGSNICRLFSSSGSRGLLLVSCCWHALTTAGFPLSQALQRRGLSIHQVSLMLATQPFDMWANIDSNGQRDSAKLLFYRSLLKLFWRISEREWASSSEERPKNNCSCSSSFAPIPHLEPGFLRRMAQRKHDLTFSDFVHAVLEFYIFDATMRKSEYTWDNTICASCRPSQEAFFLRQLQNDRDKSLEMELGPLHFPSFLGLTVLRMWMCHTVESLFLMDRTLYLYESSFSENPSALKSSAISLIPLFDGKISPRMYGICVRRF